MIYGIAAISAGNGSGAVCAEDGAGMGAGIVRNAAGVDGGEGE